MQKDEALKQIEIMKEIVERNKEMVSKVSSYLILWGIISIIGFLFTNYLKQWSWLYWTIAGFGGGAASAYLGKRESLTTGKYTALVGHQIAYVFITMFLCGMAASMVIGTTLSGKLDNSSLELIIGILWIALISIGWTTAGILSGNSAYMIIPAILLLISATITAIAAPAFFYYSIAIFGGGGMLVSGLLAKTKNK